MVEGSRKEWREGGKRGERTEGGEGRGRKRVVGRRERGGGTNLLNAGNKLSSNDDLHLL